MEIHFFDSKLAFTATKPNDKQRNEITKSRLQGGLVDGVDDDQPSVVNSLCLVKVPGMT
jgi:hypothetical protein